MEKQLELMIGSFEDASKLSYFHLTTLLHLQKP